MRGEVRGEVRARCGPGVGQMRARSRRGAWGVRGGVVPPGRRRRPSRRSRRGCRARCCCCRRCCRRRRRCCCSRRHAGCRAGGGRAAAARRAARPACRVARAAGRRRRSGWCPCGRRHARAPPPPPCAPGAATGRREREGRCGGEGSGGQWQGWRGATARLLFRREEDPVEGSLVAPHQLEHRILQGGEALSRGEARVLHRHVHLPGGGPERRWGRGRRSRRGPRRGGCEGGAGGVRGRL